MKDPKAIKVVLADDHELFRDGFKVMLKKHGEIYLIGEAENGEQLINMAHHHKPDVIVTDIKMPRMDGIAATKQLQKELPKIGVIALSMHDEENLIVDMLEAGAKGYLLKSANKEEIVEAIETVHKDKTYYCTSTNHKLAKLIAKSSFQPFKKKKEIEFTDRELSVIDMICKEYTIKEMAYELKLSNRTIETHRENIMHKIEAKNIAGVVIYAIKHGLININ